jgi:TRAP-type C4-dicarboxylate transport system permease small subunit
LQKIVVIFTSAVTMLLLFYMSHISVQYTQYIKMLGKVTPALRLPAWWITIPLSIGFFLGGLQYLLNIFINLRNPEIYIGTEKVVDELSTDTVFDLIDPGPGQDEEGK